MTQDRPLRSRSRTYLLPLMVAMPVFFVLFAMIEGRLLIDIVESRWRSGAGNVWQALQVARGWVWIFAGAGALCGLGWGWGILLPLKRYKAQLDRLAEEGTTGKLDVEETSELSFLADSFNRVIEEVGKTLPKHVQAILGSVTSGVILLDPKGNVERANPYAARLLQTEVERVEGSPYREALHRSAELIALVEKALETQADYPRESVSITDRYDDTRSIGVWLAWVRDSERRPVSLVLTLMDIGKLESFSSGLRSAERLSLLGNISKGIAHEIRNPLSSIRGLAQLIGSHEGVSPKKLESYAKIMVGEVDRVSRVLDRLSLVVPSQPEKQEVIPVAQVFESVQEMAAHLARTREARLEIEVQDPDLCVSGRLKLLTRAVLNVAINGLEATPQGGSVRLCASPDENGKVSISVQNTGPPIPPGEIDDIFQPFHTTKPNAAGLGLTITESVVRDHDGVLTVYSGNEGTTVTITLPGTVMKQPAQ